MTSARPAPARTVTRIATVAGGGFAAFYTFYTTAPSTLDAPGISAGVRISIVMLIVVAIQPLLLLGRNWVKNRRLVVTIALACMGLGNAVLPGAGHWPGSILLGLGFGVFVVMSTVWVKEQAALGQTGRALGAYGFGSAVGGALGAPIGLYAAELGGLLAVAFVGSAFALCAVIAAQSAKAPLDHHSRQPTTSVPEEPADSSPAERSRNTSTTAVIVASLFGQLLAVSLYAVVLSSVGATGGAWLPVLAALTLQTCLAPGRLVGGGLADRHSPLAILMAAAVLLILATIGFYAAASHLGMLLLAAGVGLASGAGQTAALTAMMRRAHTAQSTEAASAGWNIAFDTGLGIGAFAAGRVALQG